MNASDPTHDLPRAPRALASLGALAPALAIALVFGCSPEGGPSGPRQNLVLVVVDTLRADRLGCYGWRESTSPHLDTLAGEGVLFEDLHCHVPQTLPSFCSILTGTYPRTHGVRSNGIFSLPASARTLAETLRDEGYRTGAFVSGFPLDARFGIDQGFETYADEMRTERVQRDRPDNQPWLGHTVGAFETTADLVTDDALRWLDAEDPRPFFLMVHYFDPHHDYLPPEGYRAFPHPYSGEVAFADAQFGRLLAKLDELGHKDDTLVAFTADHGECLGEHDRVQHQALLVEATLRVPLVLRLPGVLPAGRRVRGRAGSIDVMPTLLELCGVRIPGTVEGRSLVSSVEPGETATDEVHFESLYGVLEVDAGVTRTGLLRGPWKLVRNQGIDPDTGQAREGYELYHLLQDPDELRNLANRRTNVLSKLQQAIEAYEDEHPVGSADVVSPDAAVIEKLRALGYF